MADAEDIALLKSGNIDLSHCDFREADLSNLVLTGRIFHNALLEKSICSGTDFSGCDFSGAKISFMKANGANFKNSKMPNVHFGYVDLANASLDDAELVNANFQNVNLEKASISGANLLNATMNADTKLDGVIISETTNFDGLKVTRAISRAPIFSDYTFHKGILTRTEAHEKKDVLEETFSEKDNGTSFPEGTQNSAITQSHIKFLIKNTFVTRVTAKEFAIQIKETLKNVPASDGNKLPAPLQSFFEVAEILDEIAEHIPQPDDTLEINTLNLRIAQLEEIISRITAELQDKNLALNTANILLEDNGFVANVKRSAGKAFGTGIGVGASALITAAAPAAAVYFLGFDHPIVTSYLAVLGRFSSSS